MAPGFRVALCRGLRVLMVWPPMRASPCRRGLARGLPELLAEVRLVGKTALRRDVTQGRIGRKHVLRGQFHAASYDESVRRYPKCTLEGAGEVRTAAQNERAEIGDEDRPGDMSVNIVAHLARLPGQQASPCVWNISRR